MSTPKEVDVEVERTDADRGTERPASKTPTEAEIRSPTRKLVLQEKTVKENEGIFGV